MNTLKRSLLFSTIILVFTTCKNDLKLNAPYREIPSIYAVLSGQESAHIIRVNKVFLGEGDANVMAKVADSINYQPGELTITLDRYVNGVQVDAAPIDQKRTIVFRDSVVQAVPGAFNTTQRVYVAYEDLHEEKPRYNLGGQTNVNPKWRVTGDYVLTVKNNKTGNVFKAKSTIVDSIAPTNTKPFVAPYYPYPYDPTRPESDFIDYSELERTYSVKFFPNSAQIYQLAIRMHFIDSMNPYNNLRYVDYTHGNLNVTRDKRLPLSGGTPYLIYEFKGKDVFSAAGIGLDRMGLNNEVFGRRLYMIEYFIYSSTQDYEDYMEFVKPSLNITQNKPLYSNFENRTALGIFTFRARHSVKKMLSQPFLSGFYYSPYTCKYLFYSADLSRKGCP